MNWGSWADTSLFAKIIFLIFNQPHSYKFILTNQSIEQARIKAIFLFFKEAHTHVFYSWLVILIEAHQFSFKILFSSPNRLSYKIYMDIFKSHINFLLWADLCFSQMLWFQNFLFFLPKFFGTFLLWSSDIIQFEIYENFLYLFYRFQNSYLEVAKKLFFLQILFFFLFKLMIRIQLVS